MQSETQQQRERNREIRAGLSFSNELKAQFDQPSAGAQRAMAAQTAPVSTTGLWLAFGAWVVCMAVLSRFVTPYMIAATVAYSAMVAGVLNRKNQKTHTRFMGSAILLDLGIVLSLEVQRHAIKTAIGFSLSPLQQCHIGASTIAVALYFPVIYFGLKRYLGKGDQKTRSRHMTAGKWAFVFRTLGFLLMFSLLWKKP